MSNHHTLTINGLRIAFTATPISPYHPGNSTGRPDTWEPPESAEYTFQIEEVILEDGATLANSLYDELCEAVEG